MKVHFWPYDKIEGMTVTMVLQASGTVLAPTFEGGGPVNSSNFHDHLINGEYWWGDGTYLREDKDGGVSCAGASKPVTGQSREQIGKPHTYKQPGHYQLAYRATYCSPTGPRKVAFAWSIDLPVPSASPSP
jgi:hypothetical protein